ncbi:MAG TPA: hypothetical protein VFH27_02460, partial [Longimicrobiaceae bacterium]|nr:hypothetical protein [Longimicrobiaceae bacterium]
RMAAENGGAADYVEPHEDLEVKVSRFFDRVNHPVLTGLALDMGGVRTDLVYPRDLPDLFRGSQVALVGRYRNEQDLRGVTLRLTGSTGAARQTNTYTGMSFPRRAERNDFLPRLWATRRVGWLMEQIRSHGEAAELRDEVVELGTRYGIVTPYTSFLAVEPGATPQDFSGQGRVGGVASPADQGVTMRRDRGNQPPPPAPMPAPMPAPVIALDAVSVTGAGAVQQSKREREQQEALSTDGTASAGVRRVGDKTFYLRDGVWTDAEVRAGTPLPVTEVESGSDAWLELVRREPRLARYFALGDRVAVVLDGRLYRTRPPAGTAPVP